MLRTVGRQGARRRSPGGRGGRRGGGGWGGGRREEYGDQGAPKVEAGQGGSRPRSGSRQRRTDGVARGEGVRGFREAGGRENPVRQRTGAPRKAVVGEDDGGGGGGHDDDDGGGPETKKWLSAGGGGSLLLYIDTPLVPGRVTNHEKRGVFCHGW
jgi:hypothetical protein